MTDFSFGYLHPMLGSHLQGIGANGVPRRRGDIERTWFPTLKSAGPDVSRVGNRSTEPVRRTRLARPGVSDFRSTLPIGNDLIRRHVDLDRRQVQPLNRRQHFAGGKVTPHRSVKCGLMVPADAILQRPV